MPERPVTSKISLYVFKFRLNKEHLMIYEELCKAKNDAEPDFAAHKRAFVFMIRVVTRRSYSFRTFDAMEIALVGRRLENRGPETLPSSHGRVGSRAAA